MGVQARVARPVGPWGSAALALTPTNLPADGSAPGRSVLASRPRVECQAQAVVKGPAVVLQEAWAVWELATAMTPRGPADPQDGASPGRTPAPVPVASRWRCFPLLVESMGKMVLPPGGLAVHPVWYARHPCSIGAAGAAWLDADCDRAAREEADRHCWGIGGRAYRCSREQPVPGLHGSPEVGRGPAPAPIPSASGRR